MDLQELWAAALRNPQLERPKIFGKHWDARALRAKARIAKRKAKRKGGK